MDSDFHLHGQQIIACVSLAQAHLGLHAYEEVDEQLGVARALAEEFGTPAGNGALVFALSALTHHRSAYEVASAIGYCLAEIRALVGLGEAEKALGNTEAAREHLRRADERLADVGVPPEARE
ncbi:hypothetical protein [Lentzea sp. NPDC060358]|uniref:hypothetical protein n=1 Tax=Lentzea sp. NPDC060358 TaxID=3347103 RepID=UPI00365692F3